MINTVKLGNNGQLMTEVHYNQVNYHLEPKYLFDKSEIVLPRFAVLMKTKFVLGFKVKLNLGQSH